MSDQIKHNDFIHTKNAQFGYTLGTNQPPISAKLSHKNTSDGTPNWKQTTCGPLAGGYWDVGCLEIETFEDMKAWEVFEHEVNMNVLLSTRSFKCECYPE